MNNTSFEEYSRSDLVYRPPTPYIQNSKERPTSHKVAYVFAALLLIGAFILGGTSAFFALKTGLLLKTWIMIGGSATSLIASIACFIIGKKLNNNLNNKLSTQSFYYEEPVYASPHQIPASNGGPPFLYGNGYLSSS